MATLYSNSDPHINQIQGRIVIIHAKNFVDPVIEKTV